MPNFFGTPIKNSKKSKLVDIYLLLKNIIYIKFFTYIKEKNSFLLSFTNTLKLELLFNNNK